MKPYFPLHKKKNWVLVKLDENLRLSDFQRHAGLSNFTKKWKDERQKIKGSANISARLVKLKVNKKKDYVTFVFYSAPTHDFTASVTDPKENMKIKGEHPFYIQEIRILDFYKWAKTTPGYKSAKQLSVKDLKEILKAADIQVWCNDPSFHWQGDNYIVSQFNASIYPTDIPQKKKKKFHNDDNFVCKHLSMIFAQINFFLNNMCSMLNSYLKKH